MSPRSEKLKTKALVMRIFSGLFNWKETQLSGLCEISMNQKEYYIPKSPLMPFTLIFIGLGSCMFLFGLLGMMNVFMIHENGSVIIRLGWSS